MKLFLYISFLFIYSSSFSGYAQTCLDSILENKIELVENNLISSIHIAGEKLERKNIIEQMQYYKVPAVSIAIVNDGKIDWAKSYNIVPQGSVTPETLFQAASISKFITAIIVLSLVEENKFFLDYDVNNFLKTWKIINNSYTETEKVTLRRLLSHTAGLNLASFEGYDSELNTEDIPNILQVLFGNSPAKNSPIELINIPGEKYFYSGGGYIVVQKMIEDLTERSFSQLAFETIFKPLNMKFSTFELIRPNNTFNNIAEGYSDGSPIVGSWKLYPESAAAGLWTTPSELAEVIIEIQNAFDGKSNTFLSSKTIKEMFTLQPNSKIGLGVMINRLNSNIIEFSSSGINHGYCAYFIGFTEIGKGAVIMTNSTQGGKIMFEILRSIAEVYAWPEDFTHQSKIKQTIVIDSSAYAKYVGKFKMHTFHSSDSPIIVTVFTKNNKLFVNFSFENKDLELIPESDTKFFNLEKEFDLTFSQNNNELEIMGIRAYRYESEF